MEILTGLSICPETQTFLVLTQYFRNLRLEPTTAIQTSIRGNKPWTSSSSPFLECGELCCSVNPACILYSDWQPQWEASWPDSPSSNSNHQRDMLCKRLHPCQSAVEVSGFLLPLINGPKACYAGNFLHTIFPELVLMELEQSNCFLWL